MPLSLPNLDDLRWEDLVEEGRTLIPAWAPAWTNHNPSDPGITLVELFAFFSEKLMYQLNRIGDKNVMQFLKLINGPNWKQHQTLSNEKCATVLALGQTIRAVTAADFELLTAAVESVARAKCIARRNLESLQPDARTAEAPGHISMVVVPKNGSHPSDEMLRSVKQALEPARLLTTRVHSVGPRYISVKCRLTIVPHRGVPAEPLRESAIRRLNQFFDPLEGGIDGKGWPFGGNVYLSEIYRVLAELPGIDGVIPTRDSSGAPLDELIVEPIFLDRVIRNDRNEIDAVILRPDELLEAKKIERTDISTPPHV